LSVLGDALEGLFNGEHRMRNFCWTLCYITNTIGWNGDSKELLAMN